MRQHHHIPEGVGTRTVTPRAVIPYDIVGITSSLGGIQAFGSVLAALPVDLPVPILVVQHVARGKPSLLPKLLQRMTPLPVAAAREGDLPLPGHVYVAPPDNHLLVRGDRRLGLAPSEPVNFCRPAADVLFRSMAEVYAAGAIVVVLTGKGLDGGRGVEAVRRAGGFAIAQDPATALAPDMPFAALDIGQADLCLPLSQIAVALDILVQGDRRSTLGGESAIPASGPT